MRKVRWFRKYDYVVCLETEKDEEGKMVQKLVPVLYWEICR